jgi:hypothetical protein
LWGSTTRHPCNSTRDSICNGHLLRLQGENKKRVLSVVDDARVGSSTQGKTTLTLVKG